MTQRKTTLIIVNEFVHRSNQSKNKVACLLLVTHIYMYLYTILILAYIDSQLHCALSLGNAMSASYFSILLQATTTFCSTYLLSRKSLNRALQLACQITLAANSGLYLFTVIQFNVVKRSIHHLSLSFRRPGFRRNMDLPR